MIERLREEPQAFDPFEAVLVLEAHGAAEAARGRAAGGAAVGETENPATEAVRFAAYPGLSFAPSAVTRLTEQPGKPPTLSLSFFGLHGPSGVLPSGYTELAMARLRERDPTMAAFFDLFSHRAVSLFVRAWEKYRLAAQARRADAVEGGIGTLLDALIGFATGGLRGRLTAPHEALRFYAGYLSGNPRSVAVLEAILSDYFGETIEVESFVRRWERLPETEQTCLVPGGYCRLGSEVVVGARVLRADSAFRIRMGPVSYARFRSLMPDGTLLRQMADLTRLFAGDALFFDVRLALRREDVPQLRLGGTAEGDGPRLGWNTWLLSGPSDRDRDEATFACTLML
ncbi:MAG: type VI secretion system baseplate subunit TssG [Alphaproteobacteria bacterium]|nr:type VI secretion system baseplate subunit TssG [Alphaproteobacteria bacterium]